MKITAIVVAVLSLLLARREIDAQQNVSIEGRVVIGTEQGVGEGVAGLRVSAIDPVSGAGIASTQSQSDGSFRLLTPPGVYVLTTLIPQSPLLPTHVRVDVRHGSVSNLLLRINAHTPLVPDDPPRASLIQASAPDAAGDATVTGAAGAVAPGSFIMLVTLDTGHAATTHARDDGSFEATLFAPQGASVLIKADPFGFAFRSMANPVLIDIGPPLSQMAGTIVRVPEPPGAFSTAGMTRLSTNGQTTHAAWTYTGTLASAIAEPGTTLRIDGTLRVRSSALLQAGPVMVGAGVNLDRVSGPDGSGSLAQNTFASTLLTPTGLPIERERNAQAGPGLSQNFQVVLTKSAPDRGEAAIAFTLALPADLPAGFYFPVVTFFFDGLPDEPPPRRLRVSIERSGRRQMNTTYLPVVRIGSPRPPRIPAMLLAETLSDGTRGVRAIEDRGRFGLSSRIRMEEAIIVPRFDRAGQPMTYRLEPFLPTVSLTVAGQPNLPLIPFRFPSGSLTLRVQAPDGSTRVIGPSPFLQPRLKSNGLAGTSVREAFGNSFNRVFTLVTECYQLSTLDPRFEVQFAHDGLHVITLDGTIEDTSGNSWIIGGTYEVNVARLMSVDTAVIPGTPFEVGDAFSPSVVLDPPVSADVEVRVRLAPGSDSSRMIEHVVRGRANRFGSFHPYASDLIFNESGEYRVDVTASFRDPDGSLWMGTRTWGSVVSPRDSPIIAHGRRGMVNTQVLGSQWFFRTQTPFPTLPHVSHPNPPFHSGDVFWAQKSDTAFVLYTFQDPQGLVTNLLRTRRQASGVGLRDPGTFDERLPLGELPLFSTRADRGEPHIDPARVDLWGYSYRFVERPMVAVRELVAEDGIQLAYWPFNDPYAGQFGIGENGDLPNDFKFYFGGVVLRGSALTQPLYAIYGSLFVLVPDVDPGGGTRVFPPFRGNGGGPSGGPLFRLHDQDIDLFFHPTALRPGAVLQRGENVSFAGYSAPPLPSSVALVVTSPSGVTRTIRGRANAIGYFHDPRQTFTVNEPGVWKARVTILFDGRTSAGQVLAPFPTGHVLGSSGGVFSFYVVDGQTVPLEIAPQPRFVRPADAPIAFIAQRPDGLTNVQLAYTATMPGFLLEEGTTATMIYTYDAQRLALDFPNLDLRDNNGQTGVDPITITLMLSGTDAAGERRHFARRIVIRGEEIMMPEQSAKPPRRRSARH